MEPQITEITEDIKTFYAHTYDVPMGIPAVFDSLAKKVPDIDDHHLYGVTACTGDKLIYMACLKEATDGEGEKYELPYYTIPKGKYLYITLHDWRNHVREVSRMFDELMKLPDVKKGAICLEDYRSDDELWLMVEHK